MTAIALLNVKGDPHLIADTLLSSRGTDPDPTRRVWIPGRGHVPSGYLTAEGLWHIRRLGRKTFFLPDGAGIIGIAGDCRAAYAFWGALSDKFLLKNRYNPSHRIVATDIDDVIAQLDGPIARNFSLLGILRDGVGGRTVYHHNYHARLETATMGDCLVTGSGSPKLLELIRKCDEATLAHGGCPAGYPISATEDMAEHICSELLYLDSDYRNGAAPDSPLSHSIGGFYEWYRIGSDGTLPMPARLDLNVEHVGDRWHITRACYAEQVEIRSDRPAEPYAAHLGLHVFTLLFEPHVVDRAAVDDRGCTIPLPRPHGTIISSTLRSYADMADVRKDHLSGPVPDGALRSWFSGGCNIQRVRRVVAANGRARGRGFVSAPGCSPDAALHYDGGKLSIWISARVLTS